MNVWILTSEWNDRSRRGEVFVEVFATKPTAERLQECLKVSHVVAVDIVDGTYNDPSSHIWFHVRAHEAV